MTDHQASQPTPDEWKRTIDMLLQVQRTLVASIDSGRVEENDHHVVGLPSGVPDTMPGGARIEAALHAVMAARHLIHQAAFGIELPGVPILQRAQNDFAVAGGMSQPPGAPSFPNGSANAPSRPGARSGPTPRRSLTPPGAGLCGRPRVQSAGVQGGSWGVQVVPQFQQSKSPTRYFCDHQDMMGSPHTTQSAPHQPHSNEKFTAPPYPCVGSTMPARAISGQDHPRPTRLAA